MKIRIGFGAVATPRRFRDRLHSDTETAAGLGIAAMAANVAALVFTVIFARILGPVDYGALAALVSAFLIIGIAGSALQIVVAREVTLELRDRDPQLRSHIRSWTIRISQVAALTAAGGVLLRGPIAGLIGVDGLEWAAAAVLVTGVAWLLLSILRGVMQGLQRYRAVAGSLVGEAIGRLLFGLALVAIGLGATGAFLASALSMLAAAAVLGYLLHVALEGELPAAAGGVRARADWRLGTITRRAWPALVTLGLLALLQNCDVIMVKRMAAGGLAGAYAADAVAAKVVVWLAIGLGLYVVPEVARHGRGRDARMVLVRTVGLLLTAGAAMVMAYLVAGRQLLEIAFGTEFAGESAALPVLAIAMTLLAVSYLICQYQLALRRIGFVGVLAAAAVMQIAVLSQVADSPGRTATAMAIVQGLVVALLVLVGIARRARPPRALT